MKASDENLKHALASVRGREFCVHVPSISIYSYVLSSNFVFVINGEYTHDKKHIKNKFVTEFFDFQMLLYTY